MGEFLQDPETGTLVLSEANTGAIEIMSALTEQHPEVAALVRWSNTTQRASRGGGIFERDRYVTPDNIYDQFRTAHDAAENDDVVSGVMELTESLAFKRISISCPEEDQEDIWNQIARDIDLDARVREIWRELFMTSQVICANWVGPKNYKVRGKSDKGITRKKQFSGLRVPLGMTILDPLKVLPVGSMMFNQEKLAYIADLGEQDMLDAAANKDPQADTLAKRLITGRYEPNELERKLIGDLGVPHDRLYLLDPKTVWRHTDTRSQYQRFPAVRLKSVFELLDMKNQLRQMDRVHLVGATNFIVLVKKGSKDLPGQQAELDSLQAQVRTLARVPVIVGDERLDISIITPATDLTLSAEKYGVLNSAITTRLFQLFVSGTSQASARADDSVKIAKVVAKGLESRRHMLRRAIEKHILLPTFEANEEFTEMPSLVFHPKRIDLEFDPATVQFLLELRARGDVSRDTVLNELDFDQADEAMKREREKRDYDKIFEPVYVPFSGAESNPGAKPADNPNKDPRLQGRMRGGTKNGGGSNPEAGKPSKTGKPKEIKP